MRLTPAMIAIVAAPTVVIVGWDPRARENTRGISKVSMLACRGSISSSHLALPVLMSEVREADSEGEGQEVAKQGQRKPTAMGKKMREKVRKTGACFQPPAPSLHLALPVQLRRPHHPASHGDAPLLHVSLLLVLTQRVRAGPHPRTQEQSTREILAEESQIRAAEVFFAAVKVSRLPPGIQCLVPLSLRSLEGSRAELPTPVVHACASYTPKVQEP